MYLGIWILHGSEEAMLVWELGEHHLLLGVPLEQSSVSLVERYNAVDRPSNHNSPSSAVLGENCLPPFQVPFPNSASNPSSCDPAAYHQERFV